MESPPTGPALAARLDTAFARNPRNAGLLLAIGRELASIHADSSLLTSWSERIDPLLTEAERGRYRCDVGLTPGCEARPTCEDGRLRLDVSAYTDPATWPAAVANTTIVRTK
jgi:hypothetical protein